MNITEAIKAGRKENKAIKRERWIDLCIYHRTDNVFYWYSNNLDCDIRNHSRFHFCVADLMSDDWETTDIVSYHGDLEKEEVSKECFENMRKFFLAVRHAMIDCDVTSFSTCNQFEGNYVFFRDGTCVQLDMCAYRDVQSFMAHAREVAEKTGE